MISYSLFLSDTNFSEYFSAADFDKLALDAYEYQKNNATFGLFLLT